MSELSTWELIECARTNLANYEKTKNPAFLALVKQQLETASKQAEKDEK